ncbi:pectinesterase inhibitor 10-like [Lactuca sativa]|uniref:pectinesterase inhibitor 10-like n=1 Tax=Lactuca sativa TaxID=4236 RepID=UPI0022B01C57|nr:pectinesterase inhibitor 10-like [Lactuca sativa]
MADSLLSSIATFHTTKIIVTDPTKFSFIGSIPEAMLGRISTSSNILQQYRKRPSAGPRKLTPAMILSIEEYDKPAKRVKKPDAQKEGPAQPKKQKKPATRLILQSTSDLDSEYVPPKYKNAPPSESESESSDEEASGQGDTPPRSPTPEIPVRSNPPSPPPVTIPISIPPISPTTTTQTFTTIPIPTPIFTDTTTTTTTTKPHFTVPNPPSDDDDDEPVTKCHLKAVNEKLDQLLSSSSSTAYSEAALKALFSSVVTKHSAILFAAASAIEASTSQCQRASLAVDASTKECKEATAKVDKLVSEAHLFLDSLQAAVAKNAQIVNASVENLQRSLQYERSNLEATRQAIEAANETLHANVNDRLTQLEAELAVENRIMDELDRRTAQLKLQTHKLCTAKTEINDLKSEREKNNNRK